MVNFLFFYSSSFSKKKKNYLPYEKKEKRTIYCCCFFLWGGCWWILFFGCIWQVAVKSGIGGHSLLVSLNGGQGCLLLLRRHHQTQKLLISVPTSQYDCLAVSAVLSVASIHLPVSLHQNSTNKKEKKKKFCFFFYPKSNIKHVINYQTKNQLLIKFNYKWNNHFAAWAAKVVMGEWFASLSTIIICQWQDIIIFGNGIVQGDVEPCLCKKCVSQSWKSVFLAVNHYITAHFPWS